MSATMARQGGRLQLEQSNMRLAFNTAKMAKGECSRAAIEETQFLIKKPHAEVQDEKQRGVEYPVDKKVKAAIGRHPAMLRQNLMARSLPCQNGTAKNVQIRLGRKGAGGPPPARRRLPSPGLMPSLPETPPGPTGNNSTAQRSAIINWPAGYAYSHPSLPSADFLTSYGSAQDSQHDTDFDSDMLTDEGTSTG